MTEFIAKNRKLLNVVAVLLLNAAMLLVGYLFSSDVLGYGVVASIVSSYVFSMVVWFTVIVLWSFVPALNASLVE